VVNDFVVWMPIAHLNGRHFSNNSSSQAFDHGISQPRFAFVL
jgi:hypothetical protein